jgi:gamma-glutamylcyclotransferase (GGCT)/AIG2-like uncharacterized protein YtfP
VRILAIGSALRAICADQAALGLTFVEEAWTAPKYRLYSIEDSHAALVEDTAAGVSVRGELVDVDESRWEQILASEPPGVTQAPIELADGRVVTAATGDPAQMTSRALDISAYRDFAAYVEAQRAARVDDA